MCALPALCCVLNSALEAKSVTRGPTKLLKALFPLFSNPTAPTVYAIRRSRLRRPRSDVGIEVFHNAYNLAVTILSILDDSSICQGTSRTELILRSAK